MSTAAPTRTVKVPGPDHPITITPNPSRVRVTVAGKTLVDTRHALVLKEANYPAVQYVPRADVDMAALQRSTHQTYCPYKGDCSYFSIPGAGDQGANTVWTYESPYPSVVEIKDHLAFYPDRVTITIDPA